MLRWLFRTSESWLILLWHTLILFWAHLYFWTPGDVCGSSYTFSAVALVLAVSLGTPGSFCWRKTFRSWSVSAGVYCCCIVTTLHPVNCWGRGLSICMCIYTHIFTRIFLFILKRMNSYQRLWLQPSMPGSILVFLLFHVVNSWPTLRAQVSAGFNVFSYLFSHLMHNHSFIFTTRLSSSAACICLF